MNTALGAVVATRRAQQARLDRNNASHSSLEEESTTRIRVRVYGFGEHLPGGGKGALVKVPSGDGADFIVVKGIALRTAFSNGDEALLSGLDWSTIQLFLLPDGEEITSAGEPPGAREVDGAMCPT